MRDDTLQYVGGAHVQGGDTYVTYILKQLVEHQMHGAGFLMVVTSMVTVHRLDPYW